MLGGERGVASSGRHLQVVVVVVYSPRRYDALGVDDALPRDGGVVVARGGVVREMLHADADLAGALGCIIYKSNGRRFAPQPAPPNVSFQWFFWRMQGRQTHEEDEMQGKWEERREGGLGWGGGGRIG